MDIVEEASEGCLFAGLEVTQVGGDTTDVNIYSKAAKQPHCFSQTGITHLEIEKESCLREAKKIR